MQNIWTENTTLLWLHFFFVSGEYQDVAVTLYNTIDQSAKNTSCWYKRKSSVLPLILDLALIKFCHETKGWSAHTGSAYWSQWDTGADCKWSVWADRTGLWSAASLPSYLCTPQKGRVCRNSSKEAAVEHKKSRTLWRYCTALSLTLSQSVPALSIF